LGDVLGRMLWLLRPGGDAAAAAALMAELRAPDGAAGADERFLAALDSTHAAGERSGSLKH
jgi:hypothetical protein